MTDLDERTPRESQLHALMAAAADTAPLGRPGPHAMHPPAPRAVLALGRRARARQRIVRGSAAVLACGLVSAGGAAFGTGPLRVPGLSHRADGVAPATLNASPGTPVGDFVNAIDNGFGGYWPTVSSFALTWYYRSGPADADATAEVPSEAVGGDYRRDSVVAAHRHALAAARVDRALTLRESHHSKDPLKRRYTFSLAQTRPGTDHVLSSRDLPPLSLGPDGRGRWMQLRISPADGWLVLAMLPEGADLGRIRAVGTDVDLSIDSQSADPFSNCLTDALWVRGAMPCDLLAPGGFVRVRIATTSDRPPVARLTYDNGRKDVVLDKRSELPTH